LTRVLLSCGEPSGDLYAGALTRELRALAPDIEVFGLGGPAFTAAGAVGGGGGGGVVRTSARWGRMPQPTIIPLSATAASFGSQE
jgi:hypothetical protein